MAVFSFGRRCNLNPVDRLVVDSVRRGHFVELHRLIDEHLVRLVCNQIVEIQFRVRTVGQLGVSRRLDIREVCIVLKTVALDCLRQIVVVGGIHHGELRRLHLFDEIHQRPAADLHAKLARELAHLEQGIVC